MTASALTLRPRHLAVALLLAGAAACGDSTGPLPAPPASAVAGVYLAEGSTGELSTVEGGTTIDRLAEGASIRLELHLDGTTDGRMFVPDAGEEGQDVDSDLAGTWEISEGNIQLDHDADTFLRDMSFQFRGGRLEGSAEFSGLRVQVVLERETT